MSRLTRILAKSAKPDRPAESLTAHSAATLAAAIELRRRIGRIGVVAEAVGDRFWEIVALAALCHDAGKVADGFQDMVHGRVRAWGQRHEVLSLGFLPGLIGDDSARLWAAFGVVTHHRPLTQPFGGGRKSSIEQMYAGRAPDAFRDMIGPVDPVVAAELADWLATTARGAGFPAAPVRPGPGPAAATGGAQPGPDVIAAAHELLATVIDHWRDEREDEHENDYNLTAILVQGAVTLADHLSSAHGSLHTVQPIGPGFASRQADRFAAAGRKPYPHQERAEDVRGHLLLRAPTGTGKTEAGLLWAAAQVIDLMATVGGVPRVFYTLPYLASINAMTERLGQLLGDSGAIGVAHSRAASHHLAVAIGAEDDPDDEARLAAAGKAVSRAAATKLFRETVRVATPYQLLRGALAGPAHAGIVVDSANSVFVLDELHAYDPRRLGFILATARLWERLGGRVAVLSATLPAALAALITEALGARPEIVTADPGQAPSRHRLAIREPRLTDPEAVDEIAERIRAGRAVLVVANTVAQAQQLYDELEPVARERYDGDGGENSDEDAAILLHSRFRRGDRSGIERRITTRYGTDAPRRTGGLVVATQVVEVSLDVDFDVLFTSAAPIEALLQRFGRVNRRGRRRPADVIVHAPTYGPRRGDRSGAEYADGIYPREPVEAGWRILRAHDGAVIDEPQAEGWLNTVYGTEWGDRWRAEVASWCDGFRTAFLSFDEPFDDRGGLTEQFDEMFDGTEAILLQDQADYRDALKMADKPAVGRLLADDYLIPMPAYAGRMAKIDRSLGVAVIDGEYCPERGLTSVRGADRALYRPGELI